MPYKLKSGTLVYRYGERGSGYRLKGAKASVAQDFAKLRASLLEDGELFEDPEFPANKKSLGSGFRGQPVEWKRPHEFLKDSPKFFVGGASRFDVKQGELGKEFFVKKFIPYVSVCLISNSKKNLILLLLRKKAIAGCLLQLLI